MNIRTIAAAAALIIALTGCAAEDDKEPAAKPSPVASKASKPASSPPAKIKSHLPPEPTGKARADYLDALRDIDPFFVDDKGEDDAISNGRSQCSSVYGDKAVEHAQVRFGKGPLREVTEAEAEKLNEAVEKYICPR